MKHKINVVQYDASLQQLASSFHSGNEYLDQFLKQSDSLDDNFGKTYVLLADDNSCIAGYYNIGLGYIEQSEYGIIRKIGGAIHINCFALDEKFHGSVQAYLDNGTRIYMSDVLLSECMERIERIRKEHVGFSFVTLSSTKEGYHLYKRNDFEELDEDLAFAREDTDVSCIPMYLAIGLEEM